MSSPPITFIKAPFAPETSASSRGLLIAFSTASTARFSVSLSPTPIKATPPCFITARISAKSRLTKPVLVTSSAIPLTAFVNISSATLKAVCNGSSGASSSNFSFGMTIKVSTICSIFSRPITAFSYLLWPSIEKGSVTMPTVKAPTFFAISAITGAEPVPVPPPRPQVIKTISEPRNIFLISCSVSLAASSPILGSDPAPKPFVSSLPSRIFLSAVV